MSQQLSVGIVGAGIAGLAAATALSRAGYSVDIYERSKWRNETGAAIIVGPNGVRILRKWGFDFDKAGALDYEQIRRFKADTLELDSVERFTDIVEKYGDRWLLFHRADLHSGLVDVVKSQSNAPRVHLGVSVEDVDCGKGVIKLADREVQKDLVVIADGAHSKLIAKVIGREYPVIRAPMSMYRCLQPMSEILASPDAGSLFKDQPAGFTTFYKTEVGRPGLLLNVYPCRGNQQLYAALVHPTKPSEKDIDSWDAPATSEDMIGACQSFHPSVQAICHGVTDVKVYNNMWRDPIETFVNGKTVLVGDAAHLMLPTHGQGASMALEDAMCLEVLFGDGLTDVEGALQGFDKLRLPRVSAVQTMSNKMMGPPDKMISEVNRFYQGEVPGPTAKTFSPDYNDFFFLYKVAEETQKHITQSK